MRTLRRIRRAHANHRRIAAGAFTIGILTLLAKVFVAGREIAIAWRYGVSPMVDAYQLAFTIVTWVPMLLIGIMAVVLVPLLVNLDRRKGDRRPFLGELNGTLLVAGGAAAVITCLGASVAARFMASRLDPKTTELTIEMVRGLSPIALLMIAGGYFMARLQARERFGYTVTEAVPAATVAILVAGPLALHGALPLIVGALIGYFAQALILARLVASTDAPLGAILFRHKSEEWPALYRSVLLMAFGQLVLTASTPIDQAFAARLGQGAVATLGFATRVIALFTGLATVVIGRALLPVLSGAAADGDLALGRRQVLQWSWLLLVAGSILCVLLWMLAPELIRILFQRGAFSASATAAVAQTMRFGLLQLPFYFGGIALVQWIAATGRYDKILSITAAGLAVKVGLNFALVHALGLTGIMVASSVMYLVTFAMLHLKIDGAKLNAFGPGTEA